MVPMRQDHGAEGVPAGSPGAPATGVAPAHGCVIGIEHEFGVTIDPIEVIGPVLTPGGALMRCSGFGDPVTSPAQYLENGARFYLDCGDHPEYATPECTNPRQLLAADCAGVELVAAMATRAERQLSARAGRAVRVRVLRNNVAPNATTWGTHENYLVSAQLSWADLAFPLASHLASRIVFAGAGTVIGPTPQQGLGHFRISQRAPYVGGVVASSTLTVPVGKPMIMARDEPLADPRRYRRLQVVCGDASSSHTATLLKFGTTLIALRLLRHGATPRLVLDDPIAALQAFSADPTLRATAPSSAGRVRATDVQRSWLAAATAFHRRVGLPPAEEEILAPWDDVLTSLERDPASAADRVDWLAKLSLLERVVEREGLPWSHPRVAMVDLAYHDVRCDRSLYGALVRAGRMRVLADPDEVARLCDEPPLDTRAQARGTLIRLIRRCGYRYDVNWTSCQFTAGRQRVELLLDDPLDTGGELTGSVIARLERRASDADVASRPPRPGARPAMPAGTPSGSSSADASEDGDDGDPWPSADATGDASPSTATGWWSSVAG